MKKHKIAIFYDTYGRPNTGGTTVRPHNLVKMLLKFNIDFKLFSYYPPYPEYNIPGKILHINKFNPKDFNIFWVENSFRAVELLNKNNILPILGTNIIPNSGSQHTLPYIDKAGLTRQESSLNKERNIIKDFKGKFWLSQSDFQEKEYRKLGLSYRIPVMRAPNPININLFCPSKEKPKEFIIGWTGKNNWAKHFSFLQQIALAFLNIKFYCFSDNNLPVKSENIILMAEKSNEEVSRLLKKCSLFISTSVTENQPLGVLEAMATELVCLGFRTSGIPEIINHGQTGFLVDLGNVEHFIVELNRVFRGYYNLNSIKINSRKFILENFSEEACIKQYINIFNKYLEK